MGTTGFSPMKGMLARQMTPGRSFILSFVAMIFAGAILLWLPCSSSRGHLTFMDALFTAVSAVCVSGFTTIDIGRDLSFTGQIVTLVLFQIGGIGIITFSVVLFGLMGRSISFREREIIQSTFLPTPRLDLLRIMKWVLLVTFITEGIGTLLLFVRFAQDAPVGRAFFLALYHAVSAFNNCGQSLFSDKLTAYQGDWLVNLTVMALVVMGGIGFIVQYELIAWARGLQKRLSLHTKIVLVTTAGLIVGGAVLFYLFEMNHVLKDVSPGTRLLTACFQSVNARTGGFYTVDMGQLSNPTILIVIVLMFIGASPGSTGGGMKTTSFALLLLMTWSRIRGQAQVNAFNRTIPLEILNRTISIIFASALLIIVITSILLILGSGSETLLPTRHYFVEYLFETVSAYGSVGLSMGVTAKLNDMQKLAIMLMMFIGRVGTLTLAFSWGIRKKGLTYAEEQVMVG